MAAAARAAGPAAAAPLAARRARLAATARDARVSAAAPVAPLLALDDGRLPAAVESERRSEDHEARATSHVTSSMRRSAARAPQTPSGPAFLDKTDVTISLRVEAAF